MRKFIQRDTRKIQYALICALKIDQRQNFNLRNCVIFINVYIGAQVAVVPLE